MYSYEGLIIMWKTGSVKASDTETGRNGKKYKRYFALCAPKLETPGKRIFWENKNEQTSCHQTRNKI